MHRLVELLLDLLFCVLQGLLGLERLHDLSLFGFLLFGFLLFLLLFVLLLESLLDFWAVHLLLDKGILVLDQLS